MDARLARVALVAASILCMGASARSKNFITSASTPEVAREMCAAAERYRSELAIEWLGHELPDWAQPCPMWITKMGPNVGAGGATTFEFHGRTPRFISMTIQGSRERLLDSVIPHEVTHTIFATHFGRTLPRWADEGACTTVEHDIEKNKQKKLLIHFLTTGQGIAFNRMFAMMEYPTNILPIYSQGYSLARYLIAQGGKRKFVDYVGDGLATKNWPAATRKHYGFSDLSDLQVTWQEWVRRGSPTLDRVPELTGAARAAARTGQVVSAPSVPNSAPEQTLPETAEASAAPLASAVRVAATTSGDGGWYARRRDEVLAHSDSSMTSRGSELASNTAATYRPGSIGREAVIRQSLARQQPIGRPTQATLEPGPRAGELVPVAPPVPRSQPSGGSYYSRAAAGLMRR